MRNIIHKANLRVPLNILYTSTQYSDSFFSTNSQYSLVALYQFQKLQSVIKIAK